MLSQALYYNLIVTLLKKIVYNSYKKNTCLREIIYKIIMKTKKNQKYTQ